jgi:hypothetical protein
MEASEHLFRRGTYCSVRALEAAIREFIEAHNTTGKPFVWTKIADEILASIAGFAHQAVWMAGGKIAPPGGSERLPVSPALLPMAAWPAVIGSDPPPTAHNWLGVAQRRPSVHDRSTGRGRSQAGWVTEL